MRYATRTICDFAFTTETPFFPTLLTTPQIVTLPLPPESSNVCKSLLLFKLVCC